MNHRHLIVRFAAVVFLLALPVAAFAQTARVEGMALQGDYIKDYTGVYTYLSGLPSVGNLVYGELGANSAATPTDRGVGAVLNNLWDGRWGTWGIQLRSQAANLGQGDAVSQPGVQDSLGLGSDPNTNRNSSFQLEWGKKFGNKSLGLELRRAFRKDRTVTGGVTTNLEFDDVAANNNLGRDLMGYGVGFGFEMNQNTSVELSGLLETRTFENSVTPPGTSNKDDGGSTWQIAGRMFWQWTPSCVVTPVIKFYNFDLSRKTQPAGVSFSNKLSGWQVGAAGNWTVGTSDLFVLGATFAQNTLEQDEDLFGLGAAFGAPNPEAKITENVSPQVFAALETHVNRWLTLRFGANNGAFEKIKVEGKGVTAYTRELSISSFHMNLGTGIKLGTLQLDAVLDNNFAQTATRLTSDTAPIASKVTATYAF
ncbi:MAG TPA: hypothetical protein VI792_05455 [Candidatus Eisenbacteria bacterium]